MDEPNCCKFIGAQRVCLLKNKTEKMKLKVIFSIIVLTFSFGCDQTTEKKEKIEKDNKEEPKIKMQTNFSDYLKAIPHIKLPLDLKCEIPPKASTLKFDSETIQKYGTGTSINGKIAMNDNFTAIIYLTPADIILPIIQTTDRNGNKISELHLYEKWCGEDMFSWGTSWAKISDDLIITLSDSAINYKRNDKGEIIEKSKKTEVRHRKFQIDEKGKINEMKN